MTGLVRSLGRTAAMARKEVVSLLRRPRLLVALIVGPFVVLSLVGFGYRRTTPPLRTMFVAAEGNELGEEVARRVDEAGSRIEFRGMLADEAVAEDALRAGEVDVVVIVPEKAAETVQRGEQAVFTVIHDRLDPFEETTISLVAQSTMDAVNRRLLQTLVERSQDEAAAIEALLPAAAASAAGLRSALAVGDTAAAEERRADLSEQLRTIEAGTAETEAAVASLGRELAAGGAEGTVTAQFVADLRDRTDRLDVTSDPADLGAVERLEADIAGLDALVADFRAVEPEVVVSPFTATTRVVDSVELEATDFYAPGAMALLIQHLAITLAGLSLVREQQLGTPEIFQVSPIRPFEVLAGKYIGFLTISLFLAAVLTGLLVWGFGVPLTGSELGYAGVVGLLVLLSLGLGFVISAAVDTDTQAVNAAMIVLLLSLFFSGFFFSLERLTPGVRVVSWALPITHALDSLRDVMFRGEQVEPRTWLVLGTGSVTAFVAAWALLARRLRAH